MKAVWIRARAELRHSWKAWLALAILIGVAGGAATAAAAGAQRAQSAYPRLIVWANAYDVTTGGFAERLDASKVFATIERLPSVAEWTRGDLVSTAAILPNGRLVTLPQLGVATDPLGKVGVTINRFKVLSGRTLDPKTPDEAVVDFGTAERFDFRVGSVIKVVLGDPFDMKHADTAPVRVVGIVAQPGAFPNLNLAGAGTFPIVYVSPAFAPSHDLKLEPNPDTSSLLIRLRGGQAAVPKFKKELADAVPSSVDLTVQSVQTAGIQRTMGLEVLALWALALLIALAALSILGQSVARQTYMDGGDFPALRAVGMSRSQLFLLGILRASIAGVVGAAIAAGTALALSPLTPIGLSRLAEPHPGFAVRMPALLVGAAVVLVLTPACAAFAAWRAARLAGNDEPQREPSRIALAAGRATRSPVVGVGVRMALEPGRGRTAVPVRSTIFGATLAIAALLASMLFWTSLRNLIDTPTLSGYTWSAFIAPFDAPPNGIEAALKADPNVAGYTAGGYGNVKIAGSSVFAVITGLTGPATAAVMNGRNPAGAGEIAFGSASMKATGARIGDTVIISSDDVKKQDIRSARYKVVGEAIIPPSPFGATPPGEGAVLTLEGYARLIPGGISAVKRQGLPFLVNFRPGVDPDAAFDALRSKLPSTFMVPASRRTDIATVDRITRVPLALSGLLALLAIGTLAQTLVTVARRRRRDLAILKTLGFVRRQVRGTVAWQAATLASVALLFGIPLGIVCGRWAWRGFAERLGVVPVPVLAWWAWLLIPTTILLALLIAVLPGIVAARTKPAVVLRSE